MENVVVDINKQKQLGSIYLKQVWSGVICEVIVQSSLGLGTVLSCE